MRNRNRDDIKYKIIGTQRANSDHVFTHLNIGLHCINLFLKIFVLTLEILDVFLHSFDGFQKFLKVDIFWFFIFDHDDEWS